MKIYISGPITGTGDYIKRFEEAEKIIETKGYSVINPARVNSQLPTNTSHEEYMAMSLVMLEMCDVIYMLNGWQESKGCGIEFEYAYEHGIAILFENGKSDVIDVIAR